LKYLLDTNICIYIIKKKPEKVLNRFSKLKPGDVGVSTITVAELYYGVAKSSKPNQNTIALQEFLQPLRRAISTLAGCPHIVFPPFLCYFS